jgi:NADH-quinone oxidoreductase subunit H
VTHVLAADPLFSDGFQWGDLTVVAIKVLAVFALLLVGVMLYIWGMRKVIADMQNRIGPNNAGPWGILQTLADGIKLFFKEQTIPNSADRTVFRLAPYLSIMPAFLMFCVVPIGGTVSILGRETHLQVADLPVGVLFILGCSGVAVYGVMLAGWSSGSKYPLLGSVRASAQLLSYEAAFGLSVLAVLFHANSFSTREIVNQQAWSGGNGFGEIGDWPLWNWFVIPTLLFPLLMFLLAATAETNHPPFDLVEAEQELVGGFHTEYSGIRFAIFFLAEFMNLITMSGIATTLFLGGPAGPGLGFVDADNWLNTWVMPITWFMVKVLALLFGTVWLRASLPRLRYDQLMNVGWKYLIELAILFLFVMGTYELVSTSDWDRGKRVLVILAVAAFASLCYGMLRLAMPKPGEERVGREFN